MSDQPSKTGLIASSALHGGLLAALLFGFAAAPKFDDATESIPVATVTQSQFNEIMKGDRDATPDGRVVDAAQRDQQLVGPGVGGNQSQ